MNTLDIRSIAMEVFQEIRSAFPNLRADLQQDDPHVDLDMDIPPQPGLEFRLNLNLQGDELHLSVNGVFWVEWFPCTKPEVARAYAEAVKGLLSGQFRIVEFLQGGRPVKTILQRPTGEGWAVVARWSELHLPLPWGRTQRVLQNRTAVWGVP